jgi:hypothetical protein
MLVSVMWWWLFFKRHQLDSFTKGNDQGAHRHEHRSLLRRAREGAQNPPEIVRAGKWVKGKLKTPPPSVEQRRKRAQAGLKHAKGIADGQVKRSLEREYGEAQALVRAAPETEAGIFAKQAQLEQMQGDHDAARARAEEAKNGRESALSDPKVFGYPERKRAADRFGAKAQAHEQHAAELQGHMGRLRREIADDQSSLATARQTVEAGEQVSPVTGGNPYTRAQFEKRARFLDAQAALPAGERDYAGLAGIAKYGRREYEGFGADGKRSAQLEIDRELAARRGASVAAREVAAVGEGSLKPREQEKVYKQFGHTLENEVHAEGHELPASLEPRSKRSGFEAGVRDWRAAGRLNGRSQVMHDAHEVLSGRKRQLGREWRR